LDRQGPSAEEGSGSRVIVPRLMLVTDRHATGGRDLIDIIEQACGGGLRFIQVRERDLPADVVMDLVTDIRHAVPGDTLVVVNGRVDVARETRSGLHLPAAAPMPEDWKPDFWGRAVHDQDEARAAVQDGARYLVVGTIYPTPSKPQFPGTGVGLVEKIASVAEGTPVFAIGGIDAQRVPELLRAGAYGIAVRRALLQARRPKDTARDLLKALSR
jgi:thiamine-phosphate pyrophosphorylase